jgi:hypothetical protein
MVPAPPGSFRLTPVDPRLNNARVDDAALLTPAEPVAPDAATPGRDAPPADRQLKLL